ncbi:phage tail sheath subtilisin-like domain-containing protein [uncultured Cohaesibacter sp.]|uniref:phage tail sheath subtilisin-like domain-containing protein n=1 Tax=uncultured Cohaesibacter sp. TaxID=1002546 RepID=UPI002AAB6254|nr:phage tail sheath subtilisin-like domain-containing protein [uncultured Cohaesibacter sp.]
MTTNYGHGVYSYDKSEYVSQISVGESGEIAIVGTAPDADATAWPLNVPVAIEGDITVAATLGDNGTLPIALQQIWRQYGTQSGRIAVIRVEELADEAEQTSAVLGDETDQTGIYAILKTETLLGFEPDLLIAPGFANVPTAEAVTPVCGALADVASKIRAFAYFDTTNGTIAEAHLSRALVGYDNAMLIHNYTMEWSDVANAHVAVPGSVFAAAMQSKYDLEKGFWWSASNKAGNLDGLSQSVLYRRGDKGCEANLLNEDQISCIIRDKGSYKLWGSHTLDSEQLLGGTIVGRRVAYKVYDALDDGLHPYIDQPMSLQAITNIASSVQSFLRELMSKGALIGYTFELPSDLNTISQIQEGILIYRLNFVEAGPIREIQIWGVRTPDLYAEFLDEASALSYLSETVVDLS